MSYTIDLGYTRPVATKNLAIPDWNGQTAWQETPWTKLGNESKGEVGKEYTCTTSSSLRPTTLRRFWFPIDNIYAKNEKLGKVNPAYQSPVKNGVGIGENFSTVMKITDSVTNSIVFSPFSGSIILNVGLHEAITADVVKAYLCDMVDQFFPKATTSSNQIAAQLNRSFEFLDETA
jgi:hypothetical protein